MSTPAYSDFVVKALGELAGSQKRCADALRAFHHGDRAAAAASLVQERIRMDGLRREAELRLAPAQLSDAHAHLRLALTRATEVAEAIGAMAKGAPAMEAHVAKLIRLTEYHVDLVLAHQHDALERAYVRA